MLKLCPFAKLLADESVIELLRVHVVEVRVALRSWDLDDLVEVLQSRHLGERLHGRRERELIEVAHREHERVVVDV
ncbi:hypothetical protein NPX13_g7035 [Xylaria arbuscula]|uniref:Uncharacterized protein n=1 Tax=Xylaria arbuscula TaxID=114810 RepID=A0A9W8NBG5_9PEZI|nr:hypothetical protein NPX13_g7035 [Xylaria arbuscula]